MPGSTDKCTLCDNVFYGKQQRLRCCDCDNRYHVTCLKLSRLEKEIYQLGPYKCQTCLSSVTTHDKDPVPGNEEEVDNVEIDEPRVNPTGQLIIRQEDFVSLLGNIRKTFSEGVALIVDNLHEELSSVRQELSNLKEENLTLKNIIEELRLSTLASVSNVTVGPTKNKKDYVGAVKSGPHLDSRKNSSQPMKTNPAAPAPPRLVQPEGLLAQLPSEEPQTMLLEEDPAVLDGEWNVVGKKKEIKKRLEKKSAPASKRPKNVRLGEKADASNLIRQRTRAIFVSRFNPNVDEGRVQSLLKEHNFQNLKCHKLKTRFETYSSFHIEVGSQDYDRVMSPAIWPVGTLISPFHGPLRKDHLIKTVEDGPESHNDGN